MTQFRCLCTLKAFSLPLRSPPNNGNISAGDVQARQKRTAPAAHIFLIELSRLWDLRSTASDIRRRVSSSSGRRGRQEPRKDGRKAEKDSGRVNKLGICKEQFATAAPIFCEAYSQNLSQNSPSSAHFHTSKALGGGQLHSLPASFVFSPFRSIDGLAAAHKCSALRWNFFNKRKSRACALLHAMPQKKTGGVF